MTPTALATIGQIVKGVLEMYGLDVPAMFKRHGSSRSAVKRELFHPLKGWVAENPEGTPNDVNPQRSVLRSTHDWSRAR